MPLQIRRGTEAERTAMTQPLAQGELLYVTNDQRLYIGNGSTLGGIQITGYTNEDAQDAAAQLFSNGTHTGITFTYNDASASISAALNLSNFAGTITADAFKGSVFGDDSTPMVDAINNIFNGSLSGNVTGNVLGNLTGTVTGNLVGNVTGNTVGYHTGDVKGSVFADDSSVIVDAVSGDISAGSIIADELTATTRLNVNSIVGDSFNGVVVSADGTLPLTVSGIGTLGPSSGQVYFNINAAKGTLATPTTTTGGDGLGGISIQGYNGSAYKPASLIVATWDASAVLSETFPKSTLKLITGGGGSILQEASLNNLGVFTAPVQKTTVYSVAGTALPSASAVGAGARAFVSDATATTFASAYTGGGANNVPVYSDGTVWRIG